MEQDRLILIVSQESEKSTDDVLKYLLYFGQPFFRINENDFIDKVEIVISDDEEINLVIHGDYINIKMFKSSWYRRGKINLQSVFIDVLLSENEMNRISGKRRFAAERRCPNQAQAANPAADRVAVSFQ